MAKEENEGNYGNDKTFDDILNGARAKEIKHLSESIVREQLNSIASTYGSNKN